MTQLFTVWVTQLLRLGHPCLHGPRDKWSFTWESSNHLGVRTHVQMADGASSSVVQRLNIAIETIIVVIHGELSDLTFVVSWQGALVLRLRGWVVLLWVDNHAWLRSFWLRAIDRAITLWVDYLLIEQCHGMSMTMSDRWVLALRPRGRATPCAVDDCTRLRSFGITTMWLWVWTTRMVSIFEHWNVRHIV